MPAIWESRGWVVRLQCAPPRSSSVVTSWERPSGWGSHQWWSWRKTGKEGKRRRRPIARKKGRLSDGEAAPAESASTPADTSAALRSVTLTPDSCRTSDGGSVTGLISQARGQQRKHSRSEYWKFAGSPERVHARCNVLSRRAFYARCIYVCDIRGCFHLQRAHVCVCVFARRPDLKRHLQYLWLREEFGIS